MTSSQASQGESADAGPVEQEPAANAADGGGAVPAVVPLPPVPPPPAAPVQAAWPPVAPPVASGASLSLAVAAPPLATALDISREPRRAKQLRERLVLIGVLASVAVILAIINGALVVWKMGAAQSAARGEAGAEDRAQTAALHEPSHWPTEAPAAKPGRATPSPAAVPARAQAPHEPQPTATAAGDTASAASVLAAQTTWAKVTERPGVRLDDLRLFVRKVWLAADAAGTRVTSGEGVWSTSQVQYVFVELQLTNGAASPRQYRSWNYAAPGGVVLADEANRVLGLVPPAETPQVQRLADVALNPGQSVTDVLVFTVPPGKIQTLRLALGKQSLNSAVKGHFAFEIPRGLLMAALVRKQAPPSLPTDDIDRPLPLVIGGEEPPVNEFSRKPDASAAAGGGKAEPSMTPEESKAASDLEKMIQERLKKEKEKADKLGKGKGP